METRDSNKGGRPVVNEADFVDLFQFVKETTLKLWEQTSEHPHMFLLLARDGSVHQFWFDEYLEEAMQVTEGMLDRSKALVFRYLSLQAKELGSVGFIQVFESWSVNVGTKGTHQTVEQARRTIALRKQVEGVTQIRDLEGRQENLSMLGRFRDRHLGYKWEILREGERTWLGPEESLEDAFTSELCKLSVIDQVVDENIKEGR